MKKLLGIVVLGLFLSGNAYAKKIKLGCDFIIENTGVKDFISYVFVDIKNDIAELEVKTNFTVEKHTFWKLETAYQENYIIIGNSRYSPEPYLKINRYTMDVFYNDHQMNDHNGKCIKLKKKL